MRYLVSFLTAGILMLSIAAWSAPAPVKKLKVKPWFTHMGGSGDDRGLAAVADREGGVVATGRFQGTAVFGEYRLTSKGNDDIFVTRMDSDGAPLWAVRAGGKGSDFGSSVAIDIKNNIYVTGAFSGTADFDDTSLASVGAHDMFTAKYDPSGKLLWILQAGGVRDDFGNGIAADSSNDVVITGSFCDTAWCRDSVFSGPSRTNILVLSLDTSGRIQWYLSAGNRAASTGSAVAIDKKEFIYITGYFDSTVAFGHTRLSGLGSPLPVEYKDLCDAFILKLDSTAHVQWARSAGGTYFDKGNGIALDKQGSVYVTGEFRGRAQFGDEQFRCGDVIFSCKDRSLKDRQGKSLEFGDSAYSLNDRIFTCRDTGKDAASHQYTCHDTALVSNGESDGFVIKYDSLGVLQWARILGGKGVDAGNGITVGIDKTIWVAGSFSDTAQIGGTTLFSRGKWDGFIATFSPDGALVKTVAVGGTEDDGAYGICGGRDGSLFITGGFRKAALLDSVPLDGAESEGAFVGKILPTKASMVPARFKKASPSKR